MTLEQISYVSQTIAAVAVVVSLIVLIQQNRQANQLARDVAIRNQVGGLQNISRVLFETPGMAEIWVRGNSSLDDLRDEDRVRYLTFLTYTWRIWEGLHAQFVRGQLDEPLWRAHTQLLRDVQVLAGAKQAWALRQHIFSKTFREFYDSNLSNGEARDIYGLGADKTS